jgi:cell division protein FtsI/penicillin-binding protein 2
MSRDEAARRLAGASLPAPEATEEIIRRVYGPVADQIIAQQAQFIRLSPERWSALSRAGLALGQEISTSALQIARAYAAIGNGGVLVRPRLVLETLDGSDGRVVTPYVPETGRRVLPEKVAREVADMLQTVVDEGTGKAARIEGYHVAGKTGTAQKAGLGGYGGGLHAAWFAGFLPRERPRVVIVVCVDQPEKTFWAADVAAPAFGRIAARLVTLMGMPPLPGEPA